MASRYFHISPHTCNKHTQPVKVQKLVLRAIISGILKEARHHTHSKTKDYLRVHLILIEVGLSINSAYTLYKHMYSLQNPQFLSTSTYAVFAQLLKQLSQLSDEDKKCLVRWIRHHYRVDWLKNLTSKLQQFISVRQLPPSPSELPPTSKSTWWLSSAVKVLALLCKLWFLA